MTSSTTEAGSRTREAECARQTLDSHKGEITVPIWDLPVRLGHWSMVLLFASSWLTGKLGWLTWHRWLGYVLLVLIVFRIYWGIAGSTTARFSSFLRGPRLGWAHARVLFTRLSDGTLGHTPLGGWNVVVMLSLLLIQVILGLFTVDVDGLESGPLSDLVSFETGRQFALWHARTVNVLIAFIILHLTAILHYWLYKRDNLVRPMVTGVKRLPSGTPPPNFPTFWRAVLGLLGAALLVAAVVTRLQF